MEEQQKNVQEDTQVEDTPTSQVENSPENNVPETEPEATEQPTEEAEQPTEATEPTEPPKDEEEVKDVLSQNGFDYKALEEEYFANGGLTEETIKKLNKIGFSNEFIADFIQGREALAQQEINELAQCVGGIDNYNKVIDWVIDNLPAETIEAINQVRNKSILEFVLTSLQAQMEMKEGKIPRTILHGSNQPVAAEVFESKEQMYEAVRDERYLKDPAYAAKVTAKIRASREAGIDLGI